MYNSEMEHFKDYASDLLARSTHGSTEGNSGSSYLRTSKQTWLDHREFSPNITLVHNKIGGSSLNESARILETDWSWGSYFSTRDVFNATDKVAARVSDRMELVGKFKLLKYWSAEKFQIANYGLGGQYGQHLDAHGYWNGVTKSDFLEKTGDRIATIMVYLADVEAGGATCFPNTGNRITVKKGDAAFWLNMYTSGLQDQFTNHGGCPVLVGSKWITNKWVGYLDQFREYPCSVKGWNERFHKFESYY
ncbi:prolyl 4-hydroxylase subunit alpha-1 [Eurytemora carolleeae]|uniref:prolyl 4-hydroxylase subunit alpha-1 n=1 Tax=Eurytemora carolleeae TaxID=1294199 RepID=UPI000C79055C|nr:prolyl 4-hydroxylase subunit alpha-1 [Eurytemora carolleeae]|eukprot:XP_023321772.1 prolyl 4-hydroxylase subunit alpha-1-like [Eurytemora affinis]